eukprot:359062-Chlamydomonas_euryale.AAC.17
MTLDGCGILGFATYPNKPLRRQRLPWNKLSMLQQLFPHILCHSGMVGCVMKTWLRLSHQQGYLFGSNLHRYRRETGRWCTTAAQHTLCHRSNVTRQSAACKDVMAIRSAAGSSDNLAASGSGGRWPGGVQGRCDSIEVKPAC